MPGNALGWVLYAVCIVAGCAVSYVLGRICARLRENAEK
jgi:hypothetical protein